MYWRIKHDMALFQKESKDAKETNNPVRDCDRNTPHDRLGIADVCHSAADKCGTGRPYFLLLMFYTRIVK